MASNFYRYTYITPHLADWVFIPSFVGCNDGTGCDPLGRFPAYGLGWKFLLPLANLNLSIFILAFSTSYLCFQIYKLAQHLSYPLIGTALIISPSFVFSLERGNSDLFLAGVVILGIQLTKSRIQTNVFIASFLGALKPFFVAFILREKVKKVHLAVSVLFIGFIVLWSYGFDFSRIRDSRLATLYAPYVEFGIDQLPSIFIQSIFNKTNEWSPDYFYFQKSLLAGVFFFFLGAVILKLIGISSQAGVFNLNFDFKSEKNKSLVLIFSMLYLLSYLSGSQVWYKTWFSFPLLFLIVHKYQSGTTRVKFFTAVLDVLMVLSVFGISIWSVRTVGTLLLALYALSLIIELAFKSGGSKSAGKPRK
jgi:hypothetical protein